VYFPILEDSMSNGEERKLMTGCIRPVEALSWQNIRTPLDGS
jgi:hypothetical protein